MTGAQTRPVSRPDAAGTAGPVTVTVVLDLVAALSVALADAEVVYCHWKSNEALDRSLSGDNDLDLLVARSDQSRFLEVLDGLGFKAAQLPPAREVPAVRHFYGFDRATGRLVHVHAHFRLVLGDDTTKNFWLPIEEAYLGSRITGDVLPVPAPELELAVLVLRMVLKHSTWDAQLQRRGSLSASERRELTWLSERTGRDAVDAAVATHLPFLAEVWPSCHRAIEPGCSRAERARTASALVDALATCARRPRAIDTSLRLTRRVAWSAHSRLTRRPVRKRLTGGGAVVALVGGDGAGKTTAVDGVVRWLSGPLAVRRVHLGRPPKSPSTLAVKAALAAARRTGVFPDLAQPTAPPAPGTPPSTGWLLWHVCTARDRRRAYTRARRVAAAGGIAVCDRYPLAQLTSMDGARASAVPDRSSHGRLDRWLMDYEARQYAVFTAPDVLAVLRVDPEVAVARKTDEESGYVRRRSTEVWNAAWDDTTVIVDAAQPAADVLSDLRAALWDRL
jgi:thymidylate kinase